MERFNLRSPNIRKKHCVRGDLISILEKGVSTCNWTRTLKSLNTFVATPKEFTVELISCSSKDRVNNVKTIRSVGQDRIAALPTRWKHTNTPSKYTPVEKTRLSVVDCGSTSTVVIYGGKGTETRQSRGMINIKKFRIRFLRSLYNLSPSYVPLSLTAILEFKTLCSI